MHKRFLFLVRTESRKICGCVEVVTDLELVSESAEVDDLFFRYIGILSMYFLKHPFGVYSHCMKTH